jgi:hypothetical protein
VLIGEIQLKLERLGFFLPQFGVVGSYIKQSMCQLNLTLMRPPVCNGKNCPVTVLA